MQVSRALSRRCFDIFLRSFAWAFILEAIFPFALAFSNHSSLLHEDIRPSCPSSDAHALRNAGELSGRAPAAFIQFPRTLYTQRVCNVSVGRRRNWGGRLRSGPLLLRPLYARGVQEARSSQEPARCRLNLHLISVFYMQGLLFFTVFPSLYLRWQGQRVRPRETISFYPIAIRGTRFSFPSCTISKEPRVVVTREHVVEGRLCELMNFPSFYLITGNAFGAVWSATTPRQRSVVDALPSPPVSLQITFPWACSSRIRWSGTHIRYITTSDSEPKTPIMMTRGVISLSFSWSPFILASF